MNQSRLRRSCAPAGPVEARQHTRHLSGLAAMVALAVACSSEAESGNYRCEIDPALLIEPIACVGTRACPCGSRCEFGTCLTDCASCVAQGLTCGAFGRCVESGTGETPEPPDPSQANFVRVSPDLVRFDPDETTATFVVQMGNVTDEETVEVRSLSPGYLVSCTSDTGAYASTCRLDLSDDRPSSTVTVLDVNAVSEGELSSLLENGSSPSSDLIRQPQLAEAVGPLLQVANRYRVRTVPIERPAQTASVRELVPGVYRGTATFEGLLSPTVNGSVPSSVAIPVRLTIEDASDGRGWHIGIEDGLGWFDPDPSDGALTRAGRIRLDPDDPENEDDYAFEPEPFTPFIAGAVTGTDPFLLTARVDDVRRIRAEPGRLRFRLHHRVASVRPESRLASVWTFSLEPDPLSTPAPLRRVSDEVITRASQADSLDVTIQLAAERAGRSRFTTSQNAIVNPTDFRRAQDILCGDGTTPHRFDSSLGVDEQLDIAGPPTTYFDRDAGCSDGTTSNARWQVFPVLTRDRVDPELYRELIISCLSETASAADALAPPDCVDMPRLAAGLGWGLHSALDVERESDVSAQQLAGYLVTRYLDVNGFVTRAYRLERAIDRHLERDDEGFTGVPSLTGYVAATAARWDLLLHPRILEGLLATDLDAQLQPDYRVGVVTSDELSKLGVDGDIHSVPTYVSLVYDVVDQSDLWTELSRNVFLGRLQGGGADRARTALREGARRGLFMYLAASYLWTLNENNRPTPSVRFRWAADWLAISRRLAANLQGIAEELLETRTSRPEMSLPWLRAGDQVALGARFRAMSEVMLGPGPEIGGVVGYELGEADRLFGRALTFYGRYRREALVLRRLNNSVEDRLDYVANGVGSEVIDLCGYRSNQLDPSSGYQAFLREPNPSNCFIDTECSREPPPPTPELALYRVCRLARVSQGAVDQSPVRPAWVASLPQRGLIPHLVFGGFEVLDDGRVTFRDPVFGPRPPFRLSELEESEAVLRGRGEPVSLFSDAEIECGAAYGRLTAQTVDPTACEVNLSGVQDFTTISAPNCDIDLTRASSTQDLDTTCYRGRLGLAFTKMLAEEVGIQEAQANLKALLDVFSVDVGTCDLLVQKRQSLGVLYDVFLSSVGDLRQQIVDTEKAIAGLNAAIDCLYSMQRIDFTKSNVASVAAGAAVTCIATSARAGAESALANTERLLAIKQDELARDLALIEVDDEVAQCFNALNAQVAKLTPAMAATRTAVSSYREALAEFENLRKRTNQLFQEGKTWASNLEKRRLTALPQTYDFQRFLGRLDDAVTRLQSALLFAHRAVEFELQQSLFGENEILATRRLEDLRSMARQYRDVVSSGRVAGGNPTEGRFVLSLRHDILQLPRSGESPANFHRFSQEALLSEALRSPSKAVYGRDGKYVGQAFPFALSPRVVGSANRSLEDITAGLLCAERVWSVGAIVVGRNAVDLDDSRLVPLFLRKRNKFFMQACTADAASIDGFIGPSSQVFRFGAEAEATPERYTSAWLNAAVHRSDAVGAVRSAVERKQYNMNLTQELAGLGLYGDYELFIPAESLDEENFNLGGVVDVLLVFDMLAVTNNARF